MAKLKTLAFTLSGLSAVSGAAYAQTAIHAPNQVGMAMMRLNSALLDQAKSETFGPGSLWASLRKEFRIGEVNAELVRRHETKFAANSAYFDRTINRGKPYMYHIATEVKKRNMPAEIALLPFIESAFVTKAKSHVGASGLWQFMPATGRHYGLEKTQLYDGRHDVYAATDAALNYLQYLHGMFGDWSLALAAYNWGEGNLGRAINRVRARGMEPTYENLNMPNETRNYVPKLLAVRNIVSNPQSFGMNVSEISNQPYFKAIDIDRPIDQSAITRLADISESEFLALNPAFSAPVYIPKTNRKLLLPVNAAAKFEKNYKSAKAENLLSWDLYTPYSKTSLGTIAAETGMSVSEIKRLNGMSGNSVSPGRSILVAKNSLNSGSALPPANFTDTDNTPDTYRSNMPQMAPIQLASDASINSNSVISANPNRIHPALPASKAASPIDFVSRSRNQPVQLASTDPASISPSTMQQTQPSAIPAVDSQPAVANFTSGSAEDLSMAARTAAETAASPISLASSLVANSVEEMAAPAQPNLQNSQTRALTASIPDTVAVAEPLALPTQDGLNEGNTQDSDALMSLVSNSDTRIQAAQTVREVLSKSPDPEQSAQARATRLAENRVKQQQRVASRLARANPTDSTTSVAAGMHRVAEGDTLFNISQRYHLSVADLITANNIKGSNIRKGQLLRVAAVKPKAKTGSVQNVAYTVRKGDTLNTIANRFNVDINDIRRWNQNTRTVSPGQRLKLQGS